MFKPFIKSYRRNHFVCLFNMLTNGQLNNTLDIVSMVAFNYTYKTESFQSNSVYVYLFKITQTSENNKIPLN